MKINRWSPAVPHKPKDQIKSSQFTDIVTPPPSYEKEKVNMFLLMGHQYARIAKSEREGVHRVSIEPEEENEFLMRRYVVRNMKRAKEPEKIEKRFILKKFQNVPSRLFQPRRMYSPHPPPPSFSLPDTQVPATPPPSVSSTRTFDTVTLDKPTDQKPVTHVHIKRIGDDYEAEAVLDDHNHKCQHIDEGKPQEYIAQF